MTKISWPLAGSLRPEQAAEGLSRLAVTSQAAGMEEAMEEVSDMLERGDERTLRGVCSDGGLSRVTFPSGALRESGKVSAQMPRSLNQFTPLLHGHMAC